MTAVKKCTCGLEHALDSWLALKLCGYVGKRSGADGKWEALELRNCSCGSTIGMAVLWDTTGAVAE